MEEGVESYVIDTVDKIYDNPIGRVFHILVKTADCKDIRQQETGKLEKGFFYPCLSSCHIGKVLSQVTVEDFGQRMFSGSW